MNKNGTENGGLPELPLGLGMALAQNTGAMQAFAAMTDAQRQSVIDRTHTLSSKKEMRALVDSIGSGSFTG